MTTICFDFGNTRMKAAVFSDDEMAEEIILAAGDVKVVRGLVEKYRPARSILSSVIPHDEAIDQLLAAETKFHRLTAATKLNFTTPVGKPGTIGADRLALCAAAVHFSPGKNNLVIALGSCITYNFINTKNEFLGGAISPGMDMRFRAMHEYTALLPLGKPSWNFPLIGYDTTTNLQSGVITGMACEIDGVVARYSSLYGNFNAVLTGGDSAYFAGQVKSQIFADLNFLFKGLYALSQLNCPS